ncbi:MAG: MurR/RpiR family transcriptional regulator [Ruminococcaceae bacterium]|nr:MurR/RpiR family transcriptional regulator [Oscillospiraceae bacterium]
MNNLYIAKLNRLKDSKQPTKSKLANFFIDNILRISSFTISSVAEETQTSYATVCRFLQEIGFSGFKEFKKAVSEDSREQNLSNLVFSENFLDFTHHDSFETISKRISDFAINVTRNSFKAISEKDAHFLHDAFKNAKHIHFFGLGTSSVSANYAYIKFFRLKSCCSYSSDIVISKMSSSLLEKGDLLFLFSSSGRTKAVIEAAKIAKSKKITVVAISDYINTPLCRWADITICTTVRDANKFLDTDFPLIQGQITIIDILYKYLFFRWEKSSAENKNTTLTAIKGDKE